MHDLANPHCRGRYWPESAAQNSWSSPQSPPRRRSKTAIEEEDGRERMAGAGNPRLLLQRKERNQIMKQYDPSTISLSG